MKHKKKFSILLSLLLAASLVLAGCSSDKENGMSSEEYEKQIQDMQKELDQLKDELAKYTETESSPEETSPTETVPPTEVAEAETETETEPAPEAEERPQIVVFGDSIWDGSRDETGIAHLLSQYMQADVYNCAIGGTRATLKEGESPDKFDSWDSTSLSGMVNVAVGKVSPEPFLNDYIAGGVIRTLDFSKTDYFILAYGLNDYFAGAPLNVEGGRSWDAHGYGGALRYAVDALENTFPDAKILLISPTYCQFWKDGYMETDSNMKSFGGGTLTEYANVCQNVAEMNNTLFIDGYSTLGINGYTADQYLEDGIHLTAEGRELYAKAVSSCLKYGKPGEVSGNSVYY